MLQHCNSLCNSLQNSLQYAEVNKLNDSKILCHPMSLTIHVNQAKLVKKCPLRQTRKTINQYIIRSAIILCRKLRAHGTNKNPYISENIQQKLKPFTR